LVYNQSLAFLVIAGRGHNACPERSRRKGPAARNAVGPFHFPLKLRRSQKGVMVLAGL